MASASEWHATSLPARSIFFFDLPTAGAEAGTYAE
jgi:hypothetical protein